MKEVVRFQVSSGEEFGKYEDACKFIEAKLGLKISENFSHKFAGQNYPYIENEFSSNLPEIIKVFKECIALYEDLTNLESLDD
jgi:hypothetical protein